MDRLDRFEREEFGSARLQKTMRPQLYKPHMVGISTEPSCDHRILPITINSALWYTLFATLPLNIDVVAN
jgi:hypothetical protein